VVPRRWISFTTTIKCRACGVELDVGVWPCNLPVDANAPASIGGGELGVSCAWQSWRACGGSANTDAGAPNHKQVKGQKTRA
jgi:hypothetical protein